MKAIWHALLLESFFLGHFFITAAPTETVGEARAASTTSPLSKGVRKIVGAYREREARAAWLHPDCSRPQATH